MTNIRSKAGHVLSTSDDPEARSLAAYVLGDADSARVSDVTPAPTRSLQDLRALLLKTEGAEGQKDRRNDIMAQIAILEAASLK